MSQLGLRIAKFAVNKSGICSKKASIKYATEAGRCLVDESVKLGRNLTTQEIEDVFVRTLPKKLRPKVLKTRESAVEALKQGGLKSAEEFMANPEIMGVAITAGKKKASIFADLGAADNFAEITGFDSRIIANSTVAHELQHAIQRNNTIGGILKRRIFEPIGKKLIKNYDEINKKSNELSLNFQTGLQNLVILPRGKERNDAIRGVIDTFVDNSKQNKGLINAIFNLENPAYRTGALVEHHGMKKIYDGFSDQGLQSLPSTFYNIAQRMLNKG